MNQNLLNIIISCTRFDKHFKENPEIFNDRRKFLHHLELFTISLESAENWTDISGAPDDQYRECPGDNMINWKDRGYSTILDILMVNSKFCQEQVIHFFCVYKIMSFVCRNVSRIRQRRFQF